MYKGTDLLLKMNEMGPLAKISAETKMGKSQIKYFKLTGEKQIGERKENPKTL